MARRNKQRKTKPPKPANDLVLPTPEQLGTLDRDFVTHAESSTKAMTYRRSSALQKWIAEGGIGFDTGAQRVIADCQAFWHRMGTKSLTAAYGERIPASTHGEGYSAQEAADEIAFRRKLVPDDYFDVFENVVRHHETAGVSGSSFAKNTPQQIQSAKVIVGFVASTIAMKLGY